jgi:hypothetical protein
MTVVRDGEEGDDFVEELIGVAAGMVDNVIGIEGEEAGGSRKS